MRRSPGSTETLRSVGSSTVRGYFPTQRTKVNRPSGYFFVSACVSRSVVVSERETQAARKKISDLLLFQSQKNVLLSPCGNRDAERGLILNRVLHRPPPPAGHSAGPCLRREPGRLRSGAMQEPGSRPGRP